MRAWRSRAFGPGQALWLVLGLVLAALGALQAFDDAGSRVVGVLAVVAGLLTCRDVLRAVAARQRRIADGLPADRPVEPTAAPPESRRERLLALVPLALVGLAAAVLVGLLG